MQLTKTDRLAFVRAVMDDVPRVDYNEKAQALVQKLFRAGSDPVFLKIIDEYGAHFKHTYIETPEGLSNAVILGDVVGFNIEVLYPNEWLALEALGLLNTKQNEQRTKLRAEVSGIIEGCKTLKQAETRLPELKKYLPVDRNGPQTANLPVANVVASLVKAGWPKG